MGKYNKSNKNNIFRDKPEITISEHNVVKNGKKMKIVVPEGKIGYGDVESHAQMAGDLATKHSDDNKAGEKAYEEVRRHRDTDSGSTIEENKLKVAYGKMANRMPVIQQFNITDNTGKHIATEYLFMKTEPSGLTRPLKIRVDLDTGKAQEIPV
tara:strand:- start:2918 stop:3379 length:462 start_codon:yes stop_codon:yes gene_type:complete